MKQVVVMADRFSKGPFNSSVAVEDVGSLSTQRHSYNRKLLNVPLSVRHRETNQIQFFFLRKGTCPQLVSRAN